MTQSMKAQSHLVLGYCICIFSRRNDLFFTLSLIQRFIELYSFLPLNRLCSKMSLSQILCMSLFSMYLLIYLLLPFFGLNVTLLCFLICSFCPYLIFHLLDPIFFLLNIGLVCGLLVLLHAALLLSLQILQFLLSFVNFSLEMLLIYLFILLLLFLYLFMQFFPLIFFLLLDHLRIPLLRITYLKQGTGLGLAVFGVGGIGEDFVEITTVLHNV